MIGWRASRAFAIGVVATIGLAGCRDRAQRGADLDDAIAAVQPFAARFSAFERWAPRASIVGSGQRSLDETLFATIRNDNVVLAAWVSLNVHGTRTIHSWPAQLGWPEPERWQRVKAPGLGDVQVAKQTPCSVGLAKPSHTRTASCVLITRPASESDELGVAMAFAETMPGSPSVR